MKSDKKGKKKKRKKIFITIIIIILMIPICALSYGYYLLEKINSKEATANKVNINEPVNILLLGVDEGDYLNKTKNNPKRSDTMMLIRYNPKIEKVYILSIPRDTRTVIKGHVEKINSAHRIGGVPLAIESIENLLDVKINYYAKVDYTGFRKCIDAIGGIDVVIPFNMDYDAHGINIHFKKDEKVHLDGKKAEEFVRWRKNNDGKGYAMGDLGRISTQQNFLLKVFEKMKSPSGIIRIPALMGTVSDYVTTNIDSKSILAYLTKLKNIDSGNIEKKLLAGEPKYIKGVSYFIYDKTKNLEYLENFKDIKGDLSNNSEGKINIDKGAVRINILNAAGRTGLALKYKESLKELGYNNIVVGNYSDKIEYTIIKDYSQNNYGNTLKNDIGFGEVIEKNNQGVKYDIVIILGKDSIK